MTRNTTALIGGMVLAAVVLSGCDGPSDADLMQGVGYESADTLPLGARVVGLQEVENTWRIVYEHAGMVRVRRLRTADPIRIIYRGAP